MGGPGNLDSDEEKAASGEYEVFVENDKDTPTERIRHTHDAKADINDERKQEKSTIQGSVREGDRKHPKDCRKC